MAEILVLLLEGDGGNCCPAGADGIACGYAGAVVYCGLACKVYDEAGLIGTGFDSYVAHPPTKKATDNV